MFFQFFNKLKKRNIYFFLFIVALIPYLQTLGFKALVYDDQEHIFSNSLITQFNFNSLVTFWTRPYFGMYIPVAYTIWGLISLLTSTPTPAFYHLLNILTHSFNTVLVFCFLNKVFLSYSKAGSKKIKKSEVVGSENSSRFFLPAAIGALFFGLHPTQAETVSWISSFKDVGSTCFLLLSFLAYSEFIRIGSSTQAGKIWIKSTFFYVISLLIKPSGVIAAPLIWFMNRTLFKTPHQGKQVKLLFWIVLALIPIWLTQQEQSGDIQIYAPLILRPVLSMDAFSFYLTKLFLPFKFFPDYARNLKYLLNSAVIFYSWSIWAAFFALSYLSRKKFPLIFPSFLLWSIALLPVSGIVQFSFQTFSTVSDRYQYFPMVFVSMAIGSIFVEFRQLWLRVLIFLVLTFHFSLSTLQSSKWKDSFTLFNYAVTEGPTSSLSLNNLGLAYKDFGDFKRASEYFTQSIQADPNNFRAQSNLGATFIDLGMFQNAIHHYSHFLELFPGIWESSALGPAALSNYALALFRIKEYSKSESIFIKALQLSPRNIALLNNLSLLYFESKQYEKCLKITEESLQYYPNQPEFIQNLQVLKNILALQS